MSSAATFQGRRFNKPQGSDLYLPSCAVVVPQLPVQNFMAPSGKPFEVHGGIVIPAIGAQATVIQGTVPKGNNGYIRRIANVFVGGGYDLTEGNLKAIKENHAYVTLGQSPFVQGYLPVYLLVDSIRNKTPLEVKFYDSGSQVITANSIAMGNKLPAVSFDEAVKMSADPAATAKYYAPWTACLGQGWKCMGEPIENEGK